MRCIRSAAACLAVLFGTSVAFAQQGGTGPSVQPPSPSSGAFGRPATPVTGASEARARLLDAKGNDAGSVLVREGPGGVLIQLEGRNMPPGPHAIHFHEVGRCDSATAFESAGEHFNPTGKAHGVLAPNGAHAGDLPNITVAPDGTVRTELLSESVSLTGQGGRPALLDPDGTALVIHAGVDDYATQPSGGAGGRIACGVVERQGS